MGTAVLQSEVVGGCRVLAAKPLPRSLKSLWGTLGLLRSQFENH